VGQIEDRVKAYQASVAALDATKKATAAKVKDAQDKVGQARAEVAAAIVAEFRTGVRQKDLIRRSGYSRERVRQILRAGGIEPEE